ncbi:hypothetical protein [Pseudooceanicola sp. MF1-13]|uniref:hypothetical protein n=1 Tax=Pseudooceanicola sp. MF1-13 TaxID=3379095 RepID=UPI0038927F27
MLARYRAHTERRGADYDQVDRSKSKLNQRFIGDADWMEKALAEIERMKAKNFADELETLEKQNRQKVRMRRLAEGPRDPWRATKHGPMRELILTAHHDYFAGDIDAFIDPEAGNSREKEFVRLAKAWLLEHFGDDVIEAHFDRDEKTLHIHAIIMPRATVEITREGKTYGTRQMLQPSIHPMIKNYEAAQDSVGEWFKPIGLKRGQRHKSKWRAAIKKKKKPKPKVFHKPTRIWRQEEDVRLAKEAAKQERRAAKLAKKQRRMAKKERRVDARAAENAAAVQDVEAIKAVNDAIVSGALQPDGTPNPECAEEPDAVASLDRLAAVEDQAPSSVATAKAAVQKTAEGMRAAVREEERSRMEQAFRSTFIAIRRVVAVVRTVERILPVGAREKVTEALERIEVALPKTQRTAAREKVILERAKPRRGTSPKTGPDDRS